MLRLNTDIAPTATPEPSRRARERHRRVPERPPADRRRRRHHAAGGGRRPDGRERRRLATASIGTTSPFRTVLPVPGIAALGQQSVEAQSEPGAMSAFRHVGSTPRTQRTQSDCHEAGRACSATHSWHSGSQRAGTAAALVRWSCHPVGDRDGCLREPGGPGSGAAVRRWRRRSVFPARRCRRARARTSRAGLEARLAAQPDDAGAAVLLADALLRQTRVDGQSGPGRARRAGSRTGPRTTYPGDYDANRMLAQVYLSQHRFREAIAVARSQSRRAAARIRSTTASSATLTSSSATTTRRSTPSIG